MCVFYWYISPIKKINDENSTRIFIDHVLNLHKRRTKEK